MLRVPRRPAGSAVGTLRRSAARPLSWATCISAPSRNPLASCLLPCLFACSQVCVRFAITHRYSNPSVLGTFGPVLGPAGAVLGCVGPRLRPLRSSATPPLDCSGLPLSLSLSYLLFVWLVVCVSAKPLSTGAAIPRRSVARCSSAPALGTPRRSPALALSCSAIGGYPPIMALGVLRTFSAASLVTAPPLFGRTAAPIFDRHPQPLRGLARFSP